MTEEGVKESWLPLVGGGVGVTGNVSGAEHPWLLPESRSSTIVGNLEFVSGTAPEGSAEKDSGTSSASLGSCDLQ